MRKHQMIIYPDRGQTLAFINTDWSVQSHFFVGIWNFMIVVLIFKLIFYCFVVLTYCTVSLNHVFSAFINSFSTYTLSFYFIYFHYLQSYFALKSSLIIILNFWTAIICICLFYWCALVSTVKLYLQIWTPLLFLPVLYVFVGKSLFHHCTAL